MSNNHKNKEEALKDEKILIDDVVMEELKAYAGKGTDKDLTLEEIDEILEDLDKAEVWLLDRACEKGNENEKNKRNK